MSRRHAGSGLMRRGGARSHGSEEEEGAPVVYGMDGFLASTNYYSTANGEGVTGQAGGFWIGVLFVVDEDPSADNTFIAGYGSGATTAGWALRSGTGTLAFRCANNVGTMVASPTQALSAAATTVVGVVGVHDGSNVRLYYNSAEVGSGTAITGYTGPGGSRAHNIGAVQAVSAWTHGQILGCAGGHDVPTSDEVSAWFDACKGIRGVVAMAGVSTSHLWDASFNGRDAPAEWVEQQGTGDNMDKTGTLSVVTFIPGAWGW